MGVSVCRFVPRPTIIISETEPNGYSFCYARRLGRHRRTAVWKYIRFALSRRCYSILFSTAVARLERTRNGTLKYAAVVRESIRKFYCRFVISSGRYRKIKNTRSAELFKSGSFQRYRVRQNKHAVFGSAHCTSVSVWALISLERTYKIKKKITNKNNYKRAYRVLFVELWICRCSVELGRESECVLVIVAVQNNNKKYYRFNNTTSSFFVDINSFIESSIEHDKLTWHIGKNKMTFLILLFKAFYSKLA